MSDKPTYHGDAKPGAGPAFSGGGFVPDLMSEDGRAASLFEASQTNLEEGVYGKDGMMPAPGFKSKRVNPANSEGGTGGAGSFESSYAHSQWSR